MKKMDTMMAFCVLLMWVGSVEAGLLGNYYAGYAVNNGVIDVDSLTNVFSREDAVIDFWADTNRYYRWEPVSGYGDSYTVQWTGYLYITEPGEYGFGTISDDGSQVWVDGQMVVDNSEFQWYDWEDNMGEGDQPGQPPSPIWLGTGYHAVEIRFYEGRYYDGVEFWWLKPGSGPSDIPYYGQDFHHVPPTFNPDTNWQIVPAEVLYTVPEPATGLVVLAAVAGSFRRRR